MICCEKCFKDGEIKGIIRSLKITGYCETCHKSNVYIYDTSQNNNLVDSFNDLLEVYTPDKDLPQNFPKEKRGLLRDILFDEWNIFTIDKEKIYSLLVNICTEKYHESPELFDSPISILQLDEETYLNEHSLLKTHNWEEFVKEIKMNNRFHTDYINTDVLNTLCSYVKIPLKTGKVLYRARISDMNGFLTDGMGAPPPGKASAGRVNPQGINYLYLANEKLTAIHEVRAGAYDYVTVGEFILKKDINIVDFTLIDNISPFTDIGKTQLAINKRHLKKISNEIAKPLRRTDGVLDYLPTQYIADFIKSKGFDGIKYKSTLNKDGFNIAIFNQSFFECIEVSVFDVKGINYEYDLIAE
jgi:RES domain